LVGHQENFTCLPVSFIHERANKNNVPEVFIDQGSDKLNSISAEKCGQYPHG